jgi:cytochrome c-type biogenesis protein CcmF
MPMCATTSVGAPYFDVMFTAVMIPAVLVMALAGFLRWKKDKLDRVVDITIHTAFVASTITLITYFAIDNIYVVLATFLSSWVPKDSPKAI